LADGGVPTYADERPWLLPLVALPLGGLLLLTAARLASSAWAAACSVATTFVVYVATVCVNEELGDAPGLLLALAAGPAFVTVASAGFARELGTRRVAWAFLAALGVQVTPLMEISWEAAFARPSEGVAALVACAPAALAAAWLRARRAPNHAVGWMAAAFALGVTSAIADRVDHAEFVVSAALFAAALAWIARRLALRGAAWCAVASALIATLTLVGMALDPWTYERSGRWVVHWLGYAHAVPAGALWLALALLPPAGGARWFARARGAVGACVLVILFVWLNLEIENAFARTPRLALGDATGHARDLATSLGWGAYAIALLLLGTARRVSPLRWASLAIFVLSIGKVFLHDLGHLDGLYRVASLAGLALSLIAVSLFYQRFVFRRVSAGASA
jgi:hypothetical protein